MILRLWQSCVLIVAVGCRPAVPPETQLSNLSTSDPGAIRFADITSLVGIESVYRNGEEAGHYAILESLGGGVGVFDFDHDGLLDLFFPSGGGFGSEPSVTGTKSTLFRQRREGSFENVGNVAAISIVRNYSHGVAIGDCDNDGFPDVLVTGFGGVTLWQNRGDGTFANITEIAGLTDQSWSSSAGWGDLNGDGVLDVFLAHYVDWSFSNHPSCGLGKPDVCPPRVFDGLDDSLYFANGDGSFRDGTREAGLQPGGKGLGVALADLDHDGDLDVYVANDTDDNFLYVNDGRGNLQEVGLVSGTAVDDKANSNGSMGVGLFDHNRDGLPDLWVTNFEDETFALYRNLGQMQFAHQTTEAGLGVLGTLLVGFGTVCGDFDGDGDEDIAVANGHAVRHPRNAPVRQKPLLLANDGRGRFARVAATAGSYFDTPHAGRGLAAGDLDNDGDLDLVFANNNEPAAVLRNETLLQGGSLIVRLVGTRSPRDGTGARLILNTSAGTTLRHAIGGGSYLSASDCSVHFGYGAAEKPLNLTIHWPSGRVSEIALSATDTRTGRTTVVE